MILLGKGKTSTTVFKSDHRLLRDGADQRFAGCVFRTALYIRKYVGPKILFVVFIIKSYSVHRNTH